MIPDELITSIDKLIDSETKKIELLRQMKRWYMLAKLMDMPIKEITGKVSTSVHTYGRPLYSKPWLENEFVIKLDGVDVVRKKLATVPLEFWPEDVRAEYERVQRRKTVMRGA